MHLLLRPEHATEESSFIYSTASTTKLRNNSAEHNARCVERALSQRGKKWKAEKEEGGWKEYLLPLASFPGSCLEIEVANHDASFSF